MCPTLWMIKNHSIPNIRNYILKCLSSIHSLYFFFFLSLLKSWHWSRRKNKLLWAFGSLAIKYIDTYKFVLEMLIEHLLRARRLLDAAANGKLNDKSLQSTHSQQGRYLKRCKMTVIVQWQKRLFLNERHGARRPVKPIILCSPARAPPLDHSDEQHRRNTSFRPSSTLDLRLKFTTQPQNGREVERKQPEDGAVCRSRGQDEAPKKSSYNGPVSSPFQPWLWQHSGEGFTASSGGLPILLLTSFSSTVSYKNWLVSLRSSPTHEDMTARFSSLELPVTTVSYPARLHPNCASIWPLSQAFSQH